MWTTGPNQWQFVTLHLSYTLSGLSFSCKCLLCQVMAVVLVVVGGNVISCLVLDQLWCRGMDVPCRRTASPGEAWLSLSGCWSAQACWLER